MKQSSRALACLILSVCVMRTLRAAYSKEEIMRSLEATSRTFASQDVFNLSQQPAIVQKWSQLIKNVRDYTKKYALKDKTLLKELDTIETDFNSAIASIKEGYNVLQYKFDTDAGRVNRIGKQLQTIIKNMERASSTLHTKKLLVTGKKNVRSVLLQAADYVHTLAYNAGHQLANQWYGQ